MEDLNPNSLKIIKNALIEPALITDKPDERYQFEREGYFYADPEDYRDEAPVFNKIVALKDSWGKKKKAPSKASAPKKVQIDGEVVAMTAEEQSLFNTYTKELNLNTEVANTLARDEKLSRFYNDALVVVHSPVTIANIVANEVARELKQLEINELTFTPAEIAELMKMVDDELISNKIAKQVFETMKESGENPKDIVEAKGLVQISDSAVILPIVDEVIAKNPDNVEKFKAGDTKLIGFFVGQVLKATGGKGNHKVVNALVAQQLG